MATISKHRLPLEWRIFSLFALLISVALGAAVAVAFVQGHRVATAAVEQALARSAQVEIELARRRLYEVQLKAQLIAIDPDFVKYMADAQGGVPGDTITDTASIADLLLERQQGFGFDLGMVLDREGKVLARTDQSEKLQQTLHEDPFVAPALRDLTAVSGFWRSGKNLYQAALMPLAQRDELIGYLIVALNVDDELAASIGKGSGADVLFLVPADKRIAFMGTSFEPPELDMARAAIAADNGLLRKALGSGRTLDHLQITFDNRSWLGRLIPLEPEARPSLGGVLLLSSSDRAFSGYQELLNLIAMVGLGALLVALPVSFLLAKATLQPLAAMARAAQEAAAGNYSARIALPGRDELARLSQSVDSLLTDLREKNDIEGFVANLTRYLPDPGTDRGRSLRPLNTFSGWTHGDPVRIDDLHPGNMLGGRYEIISVLGSGGMGVVYKANDLELDDVVALKMLRPRMLMNSEHLEQLKLEIRLARRITHPNVLRTFDFGESNGLPYVSMEYVRGMTLRYLLKQAGRIPYSAGLRIARQLCSALAAAHEGGVLHRDIKPENIILEQNGNAKLMDFGIARHVHDVPRTDGDGMFFGTAQYASPELMAGEEIDHRADIYSCGVLFCEMFCGQLPFSGRDTMEIYLAQMSTVCINPSRSWPEMPPTLVSIINKCLSRDPGMRFQSARELLNVLSELRG